MSKKPEPPSDLWEQLDSIVDRIEKDPGSFTVEEFSQRYKMGYGAAAAKINRLIQAGAIKRLGRGAEGIAYYGIVEGK